MVGLFKGQTVGGRVEQMEPGRQRHEGWCIRIVRYNTRNVPHKMKDALWNRRDWGQEKRMAPMNDPGGPREHAVTYYQRYVGDREAMGRERAC